MWGLRGRLVPPAPRWILAESRATPTAALLSRPLCSVPLTVPGFQPESHEAGPGHFSEEAMEAGNIQELDRDTSAGWTLSPAPSSRQDWVTVDTTQTRVPAFLLLFVTLGKKPRLGLGLGPTGFTSEGSREQRAAGEAA